MSRLPRLLVLALLGTPIFLGLTFLALWVSGIIVYQPSLYETFHREFPYTKVTAMEVAPLYPQPYLPKKESTEFNRVMALPRFHEYRVDGPWRTVGGEHLDEAVDLIFTAKVLYGNAIAECFNPGFALRMQTDVGPIDMLVCLECERAELSRPDDSASWIVTFSRDGLLSAKAFYVDCFVMNNLGLTPSATANETESPPSIAK